VISTMLLPTFGLAMGVVAGAVQMAGEKLWAENLIPLTVRFCTSFDRMVILNYWAERNGGALVA